LGADPTRVGTEAILGNLEHVIAAIPPHRLQNVREGVVTAADILAGLIFRLAGLPPGAEGPVLILYLHALTTGQAVMT
jgi:hypothetical protein